MYFDKFALSGEKLYPTSREHIDKLTEIWGTLPEAYVEFLEIMGGSAHKLFVGEDIVTNEFKNLQEDAAELLLENNSACVLRDSDFVFWMSQGCMFCFFNIFDGSDPAVYFFTEGTPDKFKKVSNHFSEFIWNVHKHPQKAFKEIEQEVKNLD